MTAAGIATAKVSNTLRKRKTETRRCANGAKSSIRLRPIPQILADFIPHSSSAADTTIRRGTTSWDQMIRPMLPSFMIVVERKTWMHLAAPPVLIFHTMMNRGASLSQ